MTLLYRGSHADDYLSVAQVQKLAQALRPLKKIDPKHGSYRSQP